MVFLIGAVSVFAQEIPLRNWSAPRTWSPAAGTVVAMGDISQISTFIAVTPCRVVDTRNAVGSYGGPAFAPNATRTFNIPGGPCTGIPSATAYSLNFTLVNYDASNGFVTADEQLRSER